MRATHGWTLSTVQGQSANEKRGERSRLTGHEMPVTAPPWVLSSISAWLEEADIKKPAPMAAARPPAPPVIQGPLEGRQGARPAMGAGMDLRRPEIMTSALA